MPNVVGVRFRPVGKIYYFEPGEVETRLGSAVIVETARGLEHGIVVSGPRDVSEAEVVQPLKKVVRLATEADRARYQENKRKEKAAFEVAQGKIDAHELDMFLVDVEYTFDGSKIVFYFTAEGRVDFRELVKDLAAHFRTRIELRQIGVRDEAKILGGIGPCGRVSCCASFLGEFAPVSIRMAKEQNLSLNPAKISGLCGRLLCCLRYESYVRPEPPVQEDAVEPVEAEPEVADAEPEAGTAVLAGGVTPLPKRRPRRGAGRQPAHGSAAGPAPAAPVPAPTAPGAEVPRPKHRRHRHRHSGRGQEAGRAQGTAQERPAEG